MHIERGPNGLISWFLCHAGHVSETRRLLIPYCSGNKGDEKEKGSSLGQTLGVGAAAAVGLAASAYYALYM